MVDTIRTKADILTLLADNATEDISPQNLRDWLVSFRVYGEIGVFNNTIWMNSLSAGFNVVTLNQSGPAAGVVVDTVNSLLGVDVDGQYRLDYALSYEGTAGKRYDIAILKNDALVARTQRRDTITANQEVRNMSGGGTLDLISTDEIKLGVQSLNNDFLLRFGSIRIQRVE